MKENHTTEWVKIGNVGVDSGQVLIADPCYLLSKKEFKDAFIDNYQQQPHEFRHGIVNSGWGGDGNFNVYAKHDENGIVTEMKVVFNE